MVVSSGSRYSASLPQALEAAQLELETCQASLATQKVQQQSNPVDVEPCLRAIITDSFRMRDHYYRHLYDLQDKTTRKRVPMKLLSESDADLS